LFFTFTDLNEGTVLSTLLIQMFDHIICY